MTLEIIFMINIAITFILMLSACIVVGLTNNIKLSEKLFIWSLYSMLGLSTIVLVDLCLRYI